MCRTLLLMVSSLTFLAPSIVRWYHDPPSLISHPSLIFKQAVFAAHSHYYMYIKSLIEPLFIAYRSCQISICTLYVVVHLLFLYACIFFSLICFYILENILDTIRNQSQNPCIFKHSVLGQYIYTLTRHADNHRLLPLAARQTLDNRVQLLHVTLLTVVSHLGVGLVTQPLLTKNLSVGNFRGLATGGWQETKDIP